MTGFIVSLLAAISLAGSWDFHFEEKTSIEESLGWGNGQSYTDKKGIEMNDNRTYSRNSADQSGKVNIGYSTAGIFDLQRRPKKSAETVRKFFSLK